VKAAASGSSKPVPPAKGVAPGPSKASASAKAAASGRGRPPLGGPTKEQELPSPGRRVADFSMNISVEDYLVGKFCFFYRRYVAGSGEGQLVVVPSSAATTSPSAVVRAKGGAQDPWAAICASGEIPTAAAAKDVVGTMSQRLREVSQQLAQQLKQVSCAGLRCLLFR
jgi:hypothetical protein